MRFNKRQYLMVSCAALAAVTLLSSVPSANAAVLAYENFDSYTTTANGGTDFVVTNPGGTPSVTSANGGTGFTSPWRLQASYWTSTADVVAPSLVGGAGNAIQLQPPIPNAGGTLLDRFFAPVPAWTGQVPYPTTGLTSGTYWFSAQIKLGSSGTGTTSSESTLLGLKSWPGGGDITSFGLRYSATAGGVSTIISTSNGSATGTTNYTRSLDTTYWVVAKADITAGTLSVYTLDDINNPTLPATPDVVQTGVNFVQSTGQWYLNGTTFIGIGGITMQNWQANANNATNFANNGFNQMDEIRIADNFNEVVGLAPVLDPGSTWTLNGSGDWNTNANWASQSGALSPNGIDAIANLKGAISASQVVYMDSDVTVGQLNLSNANSYFVQGAGNLTISSASTASINVLAGVHYVTPAKVQFVSNTNIDLAGSLTLSGSVNGVVVDSGKTVNISHGGNLALVGKLHLNGTGAQVVFAPKTEGSTGSVLSLDSADAIDGTGTLDLGTNNMMVHNSTAADVVSQLITSGKVFSSFAPGGSAYALGTLQGSDYKVTNPSTITVLTIADTDVMVKYTYAGDTNLDQRITGVDFAQIDAAYLSGLYTTGGATWMNGDSNYDGIIDATDFALLDAAFAAYYNYGSPIPLARAQADAARFGEAFTVAYEAALASVPEPASLSLLVLAAGGLLGRRRR